MLAIAALTLLSSLWTTGAQASAAPAPPRLEFVFEETVTLASDVPFGTTPWGKRNIVPITGGTFQGPALHGRIVPGGWDWQLTTPGGCFALKADYMIQEDDGTMIHVLNQGTVCQNERGTHDALFTTPVFEAPRGKHDWLNGGAYVGTLELTKVDGKPAVHIRYYRAIQP